MFTLRQLQAIQAIVQFQSTKRAAAHLHISQSALSKRVAEFEEVMGGAVFDRSEYRMSLTAYGESLLPELDTVLRASEKLFHRKKGSRRIEGEMHIGITELAALSWFPAAMRLCKELYPDLSIKPHIGAAAQFLPALQQGELTLAVIPCATLEPGFDYTPIGKIHNTLMASRKLIGKDELSRQDLLSHPIYLQPPQSLVVESFTRWCHAHQIQTTPASHLHSTAAVAQLVLSGMAVGFMARQFHQSMLDSGDLVEFKEVPPATLAFYCVRRKNDRSDASLEIQDFLCRHCNFAPELPASLAPPA